MVGEYRGLYSVEWSLLDLFSAVCLSPDCVHWLVVDEGIRCIRDLRNRRIDIVNFRMPYISHLECSKLCSYFLVSDMLCGLCYYRFERDMYVMFIHVRWSLRSFEIDQELAHVYMVLGYGNVHMDVLFFMFELDVLFDDLIGRCRPLILKSDLVHWNCNGFGEDLLLFFIWFDSEANSKKEKVIPDFNVESLFRLKASSDLDCFEEETNMT